MSSSQSSAPWSLPAGMRSTRALRAAVRLFDERPGQALSESEVEAGLAASGVDVNRVTVYRMLDRLAAAGLVQRQVDAARITRYRRSSGQGVRMDEAPHFECDDCHRQFPLEQGAAPMRDALQQMLDALARAGHEQLAVNMAVHGRCAGCAQPAGGSGA